MTTFTPGEQLPELAKLRGKDLTAGHGLEVHPQQLLVAPADHAELYGSSDVGVAMESRVNPLLPEQFFQTRA
jgi:hypothetical protein